jgi:hypothetical protein
MLKLLNAYSSQANEAVGNIWPQTRRQAVGTVLVVLGAAVGSSLFGVTGAAVGVLLAWTVLTVALQDLVRQATGLSWKAMVTPQIPALSGALLLVAVLLGLDAGVRRWVAEPAPWLLLLIQGAGGGLFYLAFLLFSPFAAVRDIVAETVDDLAPARLRALVYRRKPLPGV